MKIGIVGAGKMGQALAALFAKAGHEVCLSNSRGPDSLDTVISDLGPRCRAANVEECVESSEVVVLATPWGNTADAVGSVELWAGKIVIDTTNNRRAPGPDGVIDIGDAVSSELVAEMVPGARLVKAFNATPIPMMIAALQSGDARNAIYIAADDALAKSTVATLISSIGGEAVDVGDLNSGGALIGTSGPLPGTLEMLTPEDARERLQAATS
jgi:predicted dinucleotide-binding enzyme